MKKMMFLYESLHDYQKELIDDEIEDYIKCMVLANRGFNYSDSQLNAVIIELILHGKQVNKYLGEDISCFNLKENVVKSRAIKIAYELEQHRPSRDLLEFYIGLCKDLGYLPSEDVFFDKTYASRTAHELSNIRATRDRGMLKNEDGCIDNNSNNCYIINSNITLFEKLFEDFYKDSTEDSEVF